MVRRLEPPKRPLPRGGAAYPLRAGSVWSRVYHRGMYSPTGDSPRRFGPLARFDPHRPGPGGAQRVDPDRSVIYAGADLITSACEVFGEARLARVCPSWRAAQLRIRRPVPLLDLTVRGSAQQIGALPQLADADLPRPLTQQWARAVFEDDPLGEHAHGIRYRSGYEGGPAIALWNSTGLLHVARDQWLGDPRLWNRLEVGLNKRGINAELVLPAQCVDCQRENDTVRK